MLGPSAWDAVPGWTPGLLEQVPYGVKQVFLLGGGGVTGGYTVYRQYVGVAGPGGLSAQVSGDKNSHA